MFPLPTTIPRTKASPDTHPGLFTGLGGDPGVPPNSVQLVHDHWHLATRQLNSEWSGPQLQESSFPDAMFWDYPSSHAHRSSMDLTMSPGQGHYHLNDDDPIDTLSGTASTENIAGLRHLSLPGPPNTALNAPTEGVYLVDASSYQSGPSALPTLPSQCSDVSAEFEPTSWYCTGTGSPHRCTTQVAEHGQRLLHQGVKHLHQPEQLPHSEDKPMKTSRSNINLRDSGPDVKALSPGPSRKVVEPGGGIRYRQPTSLRKRKAGNDQYSSSQPPKRQATPYPPADKPKNVGPRKPRAKTQGKVKISKSGARRNVGDGWKGGNARQRNPGPIVSPGFQPSAEMGEMGRRSRKWLWVDAPVEEQGRDR